MLPTDNRTETCAGLGGSRGYGSLETLVRQKQVHASLKERSWWRGRSNRFDRSRRCVIERATLGEIRVKIEKHINSTYLRRVQAPVGVKAVLRA